MLPATTGAEHPAWCKRLKRSRWFEEIEQNVEPGVEIGMEACGDARIGNGSEGPPADRTKDMQLYGWLIGSWEMDSVCYLDQGTIQKWNGECHFGWVLEGRAIQDVWIRPKRPAPSTMYGTTLRIFDPWIGGWHIIWNDSLNQDHSRQIGRAEGNDIVQLGSDSRGLKTRWRFTEITANSFHWIGEERASESDPWQITWEHFARRTIS